MKLRTSLALLLLLFAGMFSAHAQVGSGIVTAVGAFSVPSTDVITLKAQIVSCGTGQLPLYNGVPVSLTPNQTPSAPFTASNTGSAQSVTFTVPGNDELICGGQNYSLYAITWYDNGFPLAPTQTFRFVDATTQTLANLVPVGFIPPTVVNSAGALCPAALPVFAGFDAHYNIICGTGSAGAAGMPISGGTFTGPVNFAQAATVTGLFTANQTAVDFVNGSVEVDQFSGADFCAKTNAAIAYAVSNHRPNVDASHFNGVQACTSSIQPFSAITGVTDYTSMNVEVQLGNVHVTTTYPWEFRNSGLSIQGRGSMHTQFEYVGASIPTAPAFYVHAQTSGVTNGLEEVNISGIFFIVRNSAAKYAFFAQDINRSRFDNDAFWGAAGSGSVDYESQGNVTTTLYRPKVSQRELLNLQPASDFPGPYAGVGVTGNGFEFNSSTASGNQTTDGTVVDIAAEYVNFGVVLTSANSMTFTSGTSEANQAGVLTQSVSKYNSFIGLDVEGNAVYDVTENGTSNHYRNVIATTVIFSSSALWDVWDDGNIQVGNITNNAPLSNGNRIQQSGMMNETPLMWANNLAGAPSALPFNGTSHLWGGIGGMNAVGSGGELDLFTAFSGAAFTACFYHNVASSNYVVDNCLGVSNSLAPSNIASATVAGPLTANGALIGNYGAGSITFAAGTGVTSVVCTAGHTCSNIRGNVTITNASATTSQVLGTVTFSTTLSSIPECLLSQQSGTVFLGLFPTTTTGHFTLTNSTSVSGITSITIGYECIQ